MSLFSTRSCVCGSSLRKTTPSSIEMSCYVNGARCDGCRRIISRWSTVYHCPRGSTYQHTNGYDLCPSCYNNDDDGSDSTDMMVNGILGQMSLNPSLQQNAYKQEINYKKLIAEQSEENAQLKQKYSEKANEIKADNQRLKIEIQRCNDAIEKYAEAVNTAKQTLSKKRMETATIKSRRSDEQTEYSTLQEQIMRYYSEMETLKKDGMSLKDENTNLKKTVYKLLDDKKEQETRIFNLEKELKYFASQKLSLDESKFIEWDHRKLSLWMKGLDNGYFSKYMDVVSVQLEECELSGKDLKHLTTSDIRGLGVKKFSDAKKLEICIKKLLQQQNENDDQQIAKQQNEGYFATNYI